MGIAVAGYNIADFPVDHLQNIGLQVGAAEDFPALAVNNFALGVDHIIEFHQMFADIKVIALDALLNIGYHAGYHRVFDRCFFVHSRPFHNAFNAVAAKTPDDIIFQRHEEAGAARVALTPGTAS